MEEKSFLKILKTYFGQKGNDEILVGDRHDIVIPIEWIFTEKLDREVIERAMVQLLKQHRPDYVESYVRQNTRGDKRRTTVDAVEEEKQEELRGEADSRIKNISLNITRDDMMVIVNGIDNWTKAIISENPQQGSKILQVSEEELYEKILGVLKTDSLSVILDSLEMTKGEKQYFQTLFVSQENRPMDEFTLNGIRESMARAAQNLTEYYEYLSNEREELKTRSITINQRQSTRPKQKVPTETLEPTARKCPIYPFVEREKILREMDPAQIINVHGYDEDEQLVPNVYTIFVYDNPRGNHGKLMVAEPLEGTHSTRIVFITDEQFSKFEIDENADRYEEIAKFYLEMSTDEFVNQRHAKSVYHDEIDVYREKMQYIVAGRDLTEAQQGAKGYYNRILNKIYDKKKITPGDIGSIGEKALDDEVKAADAVLDEISTKDKKIDVKGETDDWRKV